VGNGKNVELYSPTGHCNHKLAPFPIDCNNPVLVYVDDMVIACSGGHYCWEYNEIQDNWSIIAKAQFAHNWQPGVVYQEKVYVMDESNPQVFNTSSKIWSSWPSPSKKSGEDPWMVGWKDSIILLGGTSNPRGVQIFNITERTWTVMDSSKVPMDIDWSSSLMLSNGHVFVVGSESEISYYSAAIYNPKDNSWRELEKTATNHCGARLIQLGKRVFAINGKYSDLVEEFEFETSTWKPLELKLKISRNGRHSLLALPAKLFSHLQGECHGVY
jgi:hypothetical protein